jgi:hypothetical protein
MREICLRILTDDRQEHRVTNFKDFIQMCRNSPYSMASLLETSLAFCSAILAQTRQALLTLRRGRSSIVAVETQ